MGNECQDVVCGAFEGVEGRGVRSIGSSVPHHVWDYDTEVEGEKERNLIPPS